MTSAQVREVAPDRRTNNITLAPYARVHVACEPFIDMLGSRPATFDSISSTMPAEARLVDVRMVHDADMGWVVEVTITAPSLELADPQNPPFLMPLLTRHLPSSEEWAGPEAIKRAFDDTAE